MIIQNPTKNYLVLLADVPINEVVLKFVSKRVYPIQWNNLKNCFRVVNSASHR